MAVCFLAIQVKKLLTLTGNTVYVNILTQPSQSVITLVSGFKILFVGHFGTFFNQRLQERVYKISLSVIYSVHGLDVPVGGNLSWLASNKRLSGFSCPSRNYSVVLAFGIRPCTSLSHYKKLSCIRVYRC